MNSLIQKIFFFLIFFIFIQSMSFANVVNLKEEYLSYQLNLVDPMAKNIKHKDQIYIHLLNTLLKDGREEISLDIKKKLFQILDHEPFRVSFFNDQDEFKLIYLVLEYLSKYNDSFTCDQSFKESIQLGKDRKASIYFVNSNESNVPSIFFRIKGIKKNHKINNKSFTKMLGTKKLIKKVIGYPNMQVYAFAVPNKILAAKNFLTENFNFVCERFLSFFQYERDVHEKIKNSTENKITPPGLIEILYSGIWIKDDKKISHKYVMIQPYYNEDSLMELIMKFESFFLKKRRGNEHNFNQEFSKSYIHLLKLLKQSANSFSNLDTIHKIIHSDIKPENLFIEKKEDEYFSMIGDFEGSIMYSSDNDLFYLNHGTKLYMAPECQKQFFKHLSAGALKKCDIYSFGMTMYAAMEDFFFLDPMRYPDFGEIYYDNAFSIDRFDKIKSFFPYYHPLIELINQCIDPDPTLRPSFAEIAQYIETIETKNYFKLEYATSEDSSFHSSPNTYEVILQQLLNKNDSQIPTKSLEEWKQVFIYDSKLQQTFIHLPKSKTKKLIAIQPHLIESIIDEVKFLYQLGRF